MAKQKMPLSPEQAEIKAMKKEKSSNGWTKFWAVVLALVLAAGTFVLGQTMAKKAVEAAGTGVTAPGGETTTPGGETTDPNGGESMFPEDPGTGETTPGGETTTPGGETTTPGGETNAPAAQHTKATVAKALNEATAKAAKASYKVERTAKFTRNIDVGVLTSALDGIIKGVDKNADLNSVVGGFLGIKKAPITGEVKNGKGSEGLDAKYMIKAMNLTEADIQSFQVSGNKYQVQIKNCTNPDANSAWAHASNDYITFTEVNESIAGVVGNAVKVVPAESTATYKNILVTAVIENGNITSLEYKYTFDATIKIKLAIPSANGSGAAEMNAKYTNFKY